MGNVLRVAMSAVMLFGMAACGDESGTSEVSEERPMSKIEIVATDFGFELLPDTVPAGEVETALVNEGVAPHQAGYYKLEEGVSYQDYVAAILADDSQIPQLSSGGRSGHMRMVAGGDRGVRPGDQLEPGTYAVLCSIRDPETGKNHYELGMVARLEVSG